MIPKTVSRGLLLTPLLAALAGCNTVVMNPSGDIAKQQAHLIIVSVVLMLLIIVPVMFLIILFARKYRASNTDAPYEPDWDHSTKLELVIWGAPLLIVIVLGLVTWIYTHKLDPYRPLDRIDENRPIAATAKPLVVQAVAMDWKWLFIYPEQGIATVNELVVPVDQPLRFKVSATSVMNAFYVPELAGMVYGMPGMEITLNAVQNRPVQSFGISSNYSGAGYSDMKFAYRGVPQGDFDAWVASVKAGNGGKLDKANYLVLEKPSIKDPVRRWAAVDDDLYYRILNRCVTEGVVCQDKMMMEDARKAREMAMNKMPQHAAATRLAQANGEVCTTPDETVKKK
ncbi:cytochrome O ubiquinol oxidase [Massilia sp. WF1]|uniref:ubiquinol oxidase subunit II n=1 Tax=unclassified Massilia TaxID=2609279 RepID=UPI00064AD642|nr:MULTISPECIES: ubiquinol oxidase subunit II [unclassified Massilia]ALK97392.1 cytochrome ubiquinol oxidase subunit II [Massilia sp. WG5]KLU36573.1 cytochrome O ubiquinol oxidase [Massilia sp. WF1]